MPQKLKLDFLGKQFSTEIWDSTTALKANWEDVYLRFMTNSFHVARKLSFFFSFLKTLP